jgi:hypothetical protein
LARGLSTNESMLINAFDKALRAGFIEQVQENRIYYYKELMKLSIMKKLPQIQESFDSDSLVLIHEAAQQVQF